MEYATTQVPTYPCGQIGFLLGSKESKLGEGENRCCIPLREPTEQFSKSLSYYTSNLHRASFVLPKMVEDSLIIKKT